MGVGRLVSSSQARPRLRSRNGGGSGRFWYQWRSRSRKLAVAFLFSGSQARLPFFRLGSYSRFARSLDRLYSCNNSALSRLCRPLSAFPPFIFVLAPLRLCCVAPPRFAWCGAGRRRPSLRGLPLSLFSSFFLPLPPLSSPPALARRRCRFLGVFLWGCPVVVSLVSLFSRFSSFVFCGSRSAPVSLLSFAGGLPRLLPAGSSVACGCSPGVAGAVRGFFGLSGRGFFRSSSPVVSASRSSLSLSVFVSSSSARASFVARSCRLVSFARSSSSLWLSFPSSSCPPGLVPSSSWSSVGSGSWSSLALAVGSGVPALVWLGSVPAPSWLSPVPGLAGWFSSSSFLGGGCA